MKQCKFENVLNVGLYLGSFGADRNNAEKTDLSPLQSFIDQLLLHKANMIKGSDHSKQNNTTDFSYILFRT